MKKYIISVVCFLLICTLLSLHVAAATISTSFNVSSYAIQYVNWYDPYSTEEESGELYYTYTPTSSGFSLDFVSHSYPQVEIRFNAIGDWMDDAFFSTSGYESYYLVVSFTLSNYTDTPNYSSSILGLLNPSDYYNFYDDYDYAIVDRFDNGNTVVTYRISDPNFFLNSNNTPRPYFNFYLMLEGNFDFSNNLTFLNDGINVYREFPDSGGGDSDETTAPDTGGGSGGDSGGDSGSGDSNTTVIINKLDTVEQLLDDLKSAGVQQIELQATQNVLISHLPDKLKNMSLGTVTRPQIPSDKLSGLQQKEDELYDKSDQLLSDKNSVIDGDFYNYVKPSFGNSDQAHDLFFTRLFDIPWINKMVFISLWFGLGGFILRLGRKLN